MLQLETLSASKNAANKRKNKLFGRIDIGGAKGSMASEVFGDDIGVSSNIPEIHSLSTAFQKEKSVCKGSRGHALLHEMKERVTRTETLKEKRRRLVNGAQNGFIA
jgi:hypothetical protein